MSEPTPPSQSDFLREMERLHRAQLGAQTAEEREAADDAMTHFLRMNGSGRLQEYFANRAERTHE